MFCTTIFLYWNYLYTYFVAAIAVSGKTFDNLEYEWADDEYKWDKDRNLKAREPYFSSVNFKEQDQATTKATFEKLFEAVFKNFEVHDKQDETVQKQHR